MQHTVPTLTASLLLLLAAPLPAAAQSSHVHHAAATSHAGHKALEDHALQVRRLGATSVQGEEELELRITAANGALMRRTEMVHTRPMHLLITTPATTPLQHVHPVVQPDGTWRVKAKLASNVDHVFFAEFTPKGGAPRLAKTTVPATQRNGEMDAALPPAVQPASGTFGGYQVAMYVQPGEQPDQRRITFHVSRNGTPVEFTPYLGERGHAALFTAGATRMVHAHPMQDAKPGHVGFLVPVQQGERMRVWGEFQVGDDHVLADFVMDPQVMWEG